MFEKVVQFFQSRKTTTRVQPKVAVDYYRWEDDDLTTPLKQQWESLLEELKASPELIKKREWSSSYGNGKRREHIITEIDGVVVNLDGPLYIDPSWVKPLEMAPQTDTERANDLVDQTITQGFTLWSLAHCSERKYEALIEFIKATRASRESSH